MKWPSYRGHLTTVLYIYIQQNCSADAEDFRKMQCSEYNTIPFRGRHFNWIPFTGCELCSGPYRLRKVVVLL